MNFTDSNQDTTSAVLFTIALEELKTADYQNRWNSVSTIYQNLSSKPKWEVPVGIINVDFNTIDERAIEDDLLDITVTQGDSLLVDVPDRTRSPYLTHTASFASPLRTQSNSLTPSFYWEFTRQASYKTILKVEADFNLGQGWQDLSSVVTPSFPDFGLYYIDFRITFSDGSKISNSSKFEISSESTSTKISQKTQEFNSSNCITAQGEFFATRSFQGYDENQGYFGKGEFEIRQGGENLDSLIVVVDGFDPSEGTPGGQNLERIYNVFNQQGLAQDFQVNNGFDIIPLNFKKHTVFNQNFLFPKVINGGTDYIERNAMVLITLLEKLNDCKTGNEPIKLVGVSMGGLIARYALTYMEYYNIPHNVDIMATIDTPHQGAVVPKGFQDLSDFINDITLGIVDNPENILQSPAAKQMLKHHILSGSNTPSGAPNFHNRFFTDLQQLGDYPVTPRKLSIISGTMDGTKNNDSAERYANLTGQFGFYNGIGGLESNIKMNYSPEPNNTINDFYFRQRISFLFLKFTVFKRKNQVSSLPSLGSLENSPGGYYDVNTLAENFIGGNFYGIFGDVSGTALEVFLRETLLHIEVNLTNPDFSFIPTKSSLDFIGDPYLYEKINDRNLICSGETPFDSYFAPQNNIAHTIFTNAGANFITQEFLNNPQEPVLDVDTSASINGADLVCSSKNEIYYFDTCSGIVSNWLVSSNLTIVSSTNFSVTVKPKYSTSKGGGFITASTGGGSNATKNIYVGKPYANLPQADNICTNQFPINPYELPASEGAETYRLVSSSPNLTIGGMSEVTYTNAPVLIDFLSNSPGTYLVELFTSNACGESRAAMYITSESCGGPGGPGGFSISPNPASSEVTIKPNTEKSKTKANTENIYYNQIAKLFDFNGDFIKYIELNPYGLTKLDVSNLKEGLYFLKIQAIEEETTYKIVVKH